MVWDTKECEITIIPEGLSLREEMGTSVYTLLCIFMELSPNMLYTEEEMITVRDALSGIGGLTSLVYTFLIAMPVTIWL